MPHSPKTLIFVGDVELTLALRDPRAMRRSLAESLDAIDATPKEAADAMAQLAATVRNLGLGEER